MPVQEQNSYQQVPHIAYGGGMSRQAPRPFPRVARLNESIRQVLADAIARIEDDRLEFVSINDVRVTRDLSRATVYFSAIEDHAAAGAALTEHLRELRAVVGREVRMRITPELVLHRDTTIAESERLEALLANPVAPPDPDLY